jgi:hypothetical protein
MRAIEATRRAVLDVSRDTGKPIEDSPTLRVGEDSKLYFAGCTFDQLASGL